MQAQGSGARLLQHQTVQRLPRGAAQQPLARAAAPAPRRCTMRLAARRAAARGEGAAQLVVAGGSRCALRPPRGGALVAAAAWSAGGGARPASSALRALASSGPNESAAAATGEEAQQPLSVLRTLSERFVQPLRDFGFGRKSVWEGGVGLFIIGGVGLLGLIISWIRGLNLQKARSYQAVFEFPHACGIQVGTPVRVRGVSIGSVLAVKPSLERVDVLVEVDNVAYKIPRNSLVEANQSGLIAETLIDITPRLPIPASKAGPLDAGCDEEGAIVCHRQRLVGATGVSMDALVAICTKLAREMDDLGALRLMHSAATDVQRLLNDVRPLLLQAEAIAAEVKPMLSGAREGDLLASVQRLAENAAAAAADVRKLNAAVLTDENAELLRQSVATLTKTLQHVEAISGDVGSVTGDSATRQNLKQLITSLSRLLDV